MEGREEEAHVGEICGCGKLGGGGDDVGGGSKGGGKGYVCPYVLL